MIGMKFTYDGISCDEYGVFAGEFEQSSTGKMGVAHATNLITGKTGRNNEFNIISQAYSSPLNFEIQVFSRDGAYISQEHERALKKWLLQRGQYKWLNIIDRRYANIHFKANIHSPENIKAGDVVGISFQVTTSTPYGYSEEIEQKLVFDYTTKSATFYVNNDEDLWIYPDMEITMLSDGDLEIINSLDDNTNTFRLEGLSAGDVITVDGTLPSIHCKPSEVAAATPGMTYQNFSKYWLRLADGYNTLTVNNNCIIKLLYREIRKVGVC